MRRAQVAGTVRTASSRAARYLLRLYLLRPYLHGTASSRAVRYCSRRRQPSSASTPAMPAWFGFRLGIGFGLGDRVGVGVRVRG
eukprot:scaffold19083_cov60-Phaeocystis_antarctica.AAC.3